MAQTNPFSTEIEFEYGVAMPLSPLVRRFVARNGGPLTFKGTNVYVLGHGEVAILDPGPDDPAHVDELLTALQGERVTRIILTHTHGDHCGALARLQALTGAKTCGFAGDGSPRGAFQPGGKGDLATGFVDEAFAPDCPLRDGDEIAGEGWTLRAVHTPGHAPDHICYHLEEENALFTGDHIMPWSTTVIAPPEGDMGHYMASLDRLSKRNDALYLPGHGGRVRQPKKLLRAYVLHRQWREKSILDLVRAGRQQVRELVPVLYPDSDEGIKRAAGLSVLAHLLYLEQKGKLQRAGEGLEARFAPVSKASADVPE